VFPKLTLSTALLLAANLTPLVGVLWLGWDAAIIILIYWTENLITGFYNVLRMAFLKVERPADQLGKLFAIPFFCVHFGGFCAVHGAILMALIVEENAWESPSMSVSWPGPLIFLQLLYSVMVGLWRARPAGAGWIFAFLLLSHGVSFVHNYLIKGEYAALKMGDLMARPYKRVVVLHVAILVGAAPIMMLGSPVPLLVLLILLKICVDFWLHVRSHRVGGVPRR
jgi:isoprenylcysteine carboxyl methyltransferase (ICMT) family protein YpbQ